MNDRQSIAAFSIIMLGAVIFLSGCTVTHTIKADLQVSTGEIDRIPIRVGLYMAPEFCHYTVRKEWLLDTHVIELGGALCNGTKDTLAAGFREVTILESLAFDPCQEKVNAIVVPEVVKVSIFLPATTFQPTNTIVRVKYTFLDQEGQIMWVDTFQGEAEVEVRHFKKDLRRCVQLAVEDLYHKSLQGILSSTWWHSLASDFTKEK